MKKRIGLVLLVLNMVLMITGCGNAIPDMSEEQMDSVGEYVAITLMKYDANHRSRLVDLSQYEEKVPDVEEEEPEVTEPEEEVQPSAPEVQEPEIIEPVLPEYDSIQDFMELPAGVSVSYDGMHICDAYPEDGDSFLYLEASGDKKLVVLRFTVSNGSTESQSLDFLNAGNVYRLKMGDSYWRNALTTMLLDDMVTYVGTLESGTTEQLVLLFEGEAEYANEAQEMSLSLKNESKTYTIQVN